tara:strand:+ start:2943 stop:3257 length:315 start_codon:yes stop_codon:yes gene_type:complete
MKILFFLLLSIQAFSQHYSRIIVYEDKELVGDKDVDVYFRLTEPVTYIFHDDNTYAYNATMDTISDVIYVITNEFLIITDETKEIIILNKEVDGKNVELVYFNE